VIRVSCSNCGKALKAPDEHLGKQGKCPQCGTLTRLELPVLGPDGGADSQPEVDVAAPASGDGALPGKASKVCDVCGSRLSVEQLHVVKPAVVAEATDRGYVPQNVPVHDAVISGSGQSRAGWWRQVVQANAAEDWGLCERCRTELLTWRESDGEPSQPVEDGPNNCWFCGQQPASADTSPSAHLYKHFDADDPAVASQVAAAQVEQKAFLMAQAMISGDSPLAALRAQGTPQTPKTVCAEAEVTVPRCQKCAKAHESWQYRVPLALFATFFAVLGLILAIAMVCGEAEDRAEPTPPPPLAMGASGPSVAEEAPPQPPPVITAGRVLLLAMIALIPAIWVITYGTWRRRYPATRFQWAYRAFPAIRRRCSEGWRLRS